MIHLATSPPVALVNVRSGTSRVSREGQTRLAEAGLAGQTYVADGRQYVDQRAMEDLDALPNAPPPTIPTMVVRVNAARPTPGWDSGRQVAGWSSWYSDDTRRAGVDRYWALGRAEPGMGFAATVAGLIVESGVIVAVDASHPAGVVLEIAWEAEEALPRWTWLVTGRGGPVVHISP